MPRAFLEFDLEQTRRQADAQVLCWALVRADALRDRTAARRVGGGRATASRWRPPQRAASATRLAALLNGTARAARHAAAHLPRPRRRSPRCGDGRGAHRRLSRAVPAVRRVARAGPDVASRVPRAATPSRRCASWPSGRAVHAACGRALQARRAPGPRRLPRRHAHASRRSTAGCSRPSRAPLAESSRPRRRACVARACSSLTTHRARGPARTGSRSATSASNNSAPSTKACSTTSRSSFARRGRGGHGPAASPAVRLGRHGPVRKASGTFYTPRRDHRVSRAADAATRSVDGRRLTTSSACACSTRPWAAARFSWPPAAISPRRTKRPLVRERGLFPVGDHRRRPRRLPASRRAALPLRRRSQPDGGPGGPAVAVALDAGARTGRSRSSIIASSPATASWAPRSTTWPRQPPRRPLAGARAGTPCRCSRTTARRGAAARAAGSRAPRAMPDDTADIVRDKERLLAASTRACRRDVGVLRRMADLWCACWFWTERAPAQAERGRVRRTARGDPLEPVRAFPRAWSRRASPRRERVSPRQRVPALDAGVPGGVLRRRRIAARRRRVRRRSRQPAVGDGAGRHRRRGRAGGAPAGRRRCSRASSGSPASTRPAPTATRISTSCSSSAAFGCSGAAAGSASSSRGDWPSDHGRPALRRLLLRSLPRSTGSSASRTAAASSRFTAACGSCCCRRRPGGPRGRCACRSASADPDRLDPAPDARRWRPRAGDGSSCRRRCCGGCPATVWRFPTSGGRDELRLLERLVAAHAGRSADGAAGGHGSAAN